MMEWAAALIQIAPLIVEIVLWAFVIAENVKYGPAAGGRCAAEDCESCPFPCCKNKNEGHPPRPEKPGTNNRP